MSSRNAYRQQWKNPKAATRLEAVKAAAATRKHPTKHPERITNMDPTREQLVEALTGMSDVERAQILADVGESVSRETRMADTAAALSALVSHSQPKKGPQNA